MLPSAWHVLDALRSRLPQLFVVLDFDGTLAPIVARPDDAALPSAARSTLVSLAEQTTLALLSGRGLADVRARVGINGIIYAGSHGLQISGPDISFVHDAVEAARPALAAALRGLREELERIDGVILEEKACSFAVHYRLADDGERGRVESAVRAATNRGGLTLSHGKKVLEVLPDVTWDKGHALAWLLDRLDARRGDTLYIGDDRTDENAFRELTDEGLGILVADPVRPTAATRWLRDPSDVHAFLAALSGARG